MKIDRWKESRMSEMCCRFPVGSLVMFHAPGGLAYGTVKRWFWDSWSLLVELEYDGDALTVTASHLVG